MENISFAIIALWISMFGIFDTLMSYFSKMHHKLITYIVIATVAIIFLVLNKKNYKFVL
jgi:hypothetical protein